MFVDWNMFLYASLWHLLVFLLIRHHHRVAMSSIVVLWTCFCSTGEQHSLALSIRLAPITDCFLSFSAWKQQKLIYSFYCSTVHRSLSLYMSLCTQVYTFEGGGMYLEVALVSQGCSLQLHLILPNCLLRTCTNYTLISRITSSYSNYYWYLSLLIFLNFNHFCYLIAGLICISLSIN